MTFLLLTFLTLIISFFLFPKKKNIFPIENMVIRNSETSSIAYKTIDGKSQSTKKSYNFLLMLSLLFLLSISMVTFNVFLIKEKQPQVVGSSGIMIPTNNQGTNIPTGPILSGESPTQTSTQTPAGTNIKKPEKDFFNINEFWKGFLYFVAMVFGMTTETIVKILKTRSKAKKSGGKILIPSFIWEDFAIPFVCSALIFTYFWNDYGDQIFTWKIVVTSYQNGFFWPIVIQKIKQHA
ncbi:MAG: hypothetical protein IPM57_03140 [Oligoflexia bacterium]|nr:hypothetical protein [Oligoflexia bacterium]